MSFTVDRYSKVVELFDLPMCIDIMQVFVYDYLFIDSFQEKNRKKEKMKTILHSVEGQASCSNERYLLE